jgi:hypothetical protein
VVDLEIGLHHVYSDVLAVGQSLYHGTKRVSSAAVAPDHTTQVFWVYDNLE